MKKILVIGLCGESVFLDTDHFNEEDETVIATSKHTEPGGKGFNQCVAIKRLSNHEVHFLTKVGNDYYKKVCKRFLLKENIKPHFIINKDIPTAYASIITNKEGTSRITVFPGASSTLTVEDIKKYEKLISKMDLVLIQLELGIEIVDYILNTCNKYHVKVVLNPAPVNENINFNILSKADVLTPNTQEAKIIFQYEDSSNIEEIINFVRNKTNKLVIITLGSLGALIVNNQYSELIETKKNTPLDTTGAGDVFNGAFVSKYVLNHNLKESVIFANKAAGYSVTKKYVMQAIPKLIDIE